MPRWVYLLGVGTGLVAVAFAVTCQLLGAAPGATEANVRRIQEGMTLQEVEAILGGPPSSQRVRRPMCGGNLWLVWYSWEGEAGTVRVTMLWDHVHCAEWVPHAGRALPLDRLRAWLGW